MPFFQFEDHRLAYSTYGDGRRCLVLIHGQLLSQRMHETLVHDLARRGNHVITIDLLGHGESDRPPDKWRYSMTQFGEQVVALLDHLDVDEAIIGGTSLGANVTIEVAVATPERCRGLMVEMPVLDNGVLPAVIMFLPLTAALIYAKPLVRMLQLAVTPIPRWPLPLLGRIVLDAIRQDHASSPAVLEGLMMGRIAPNHRQRLAIDIPTLIIGHPGDPVHSISDAELLASEVRRSKVLQANNIFELRLHPERLTAEIADFLDSCWKPQRSRAQRPRRQRRRAS